MITIGFIVSAGIVYTIYLYLQKEDSPILAGILVSSFLFLCFFVINAFANLIFDKYDYVAFDDRICSVNIDDDPSLVMMNTSCRNYTYYTRDDHGILNRITTSFDSTTLEFNSEAKPSVVKLIKHFESPIAKALFFDIPDVRYVVTLPDKKLMTYVVEGD